MFGSTLLTLAISLLPQSQTPALNPAWVLQVSTLTYGTDSTARRSSRSYKGGQLALNQPIVAYAYSGRTLCASSSPVIEEPTDAGYGWRVQIVPLRNDGGFVARVVWERLWERGERVTSGHRGSAEVTFKPGERIVFDYMNASPRAVSSNMAAETRAVTGQPGCTGIGMGLEIGLAPIEREEIFEANLWLVRTLPNGTEQAQRQTVRLKAGTGGDYYFDDVAISGGPSAGTVNVRTSGRISALDIVGGKAQMNLHIAQYLVDNSAPSGRRNGGTTDFALTAASNEVLSFNVPKISAEAERLSLRIQVRQIR